jgi:hypothetical protein
MGADLEELAGSFQRSIKCLRLAFKFRELAFPNDDCVIAFRQRGILPTQLLPRSYDEDGARRVSHDFLSDAS